MTKKEENKIIKQIKEVLGDNYCQADDLLISDLVTWLKVSEKAKKDLQQALDSGNSMNWVNLTTISMSAKSIISTLKALGITPNDRLKQRLLDKSGNDSAINNLNSFLNG